MGRVAFGIPPYEPLWRIRTMFDNCFSCCQKCGRRVVVVAVLVIGQPFFCDVCLMRERATAVVPPAVKAESAELPHANSEPSVPVRDEITGGVLAQTTTAAPVNNKPIVLGTALSAIFSICASWRR